ncbi:response regulator [Deinococcus hopiensis]|uniref:CheY chemotaxis protein or a CheY-like REC (Receiver) domain n=1 Tax=Deinococcus hopiensis KR-140 TaxID=695939 RepID=A0A1W1UBJ4_9DEIO|nr:response regulator [Deinococcus hopiensis]SMB78466.1 CheY chemotaxis protein or a CheY-like REC (receiver) domain [Deinococcus hopiensis KR-140]
MPPQTPLTSLLLVEDNAAHALLLAAALEELAVAYQLEVIVNGFHAAARLQLPPLPDIVLMDMHLPRMNGVEVIQALGGRLMEVNVVLWSAAHNPLAAVEAAAVGVDPYLEKPSTSRRSLEVLGRVLTLQRLPLGFRVAAWERHQGQG